MPEPGPGDRTPPQDMAAEQSVLGAMLISKDAIADVTENLRGADFYRPSHETIHDAIIDLYGRSEPVDMVTVAAELQKRGELQRIGGAPYLHTLTSERADRGQRLLLRRHRPGEGGPAAPGRRRHPHRPDRLRRRGRRRRHRGPAQAEVYQITEKRNSEDYAPLSEIMAGVLDEIEAIGNRDAGLYGVPTGFADLDELTNGLHAGQMIIVAARPGCGQERRSHSTCAGPRRSRTTWPPPSSAWR